MGRTQTGTRQKLIDTGNELIWRNSYAAVSVAEICTKAGVQKGSFYHFFPSKADLALTIMDSCMQEVIPTYDDIFSAKHRPEERLTKMVDYVYEMQLEKQQEYGYVCGCPMLTLGSELSSTEDAIALKIEEICNLKLTYYESTLRDLIANGAIDRDTNIEIKAQEIFSLIVGQLFLARMKNNLNFIKNDLKNTILELVGITNKELV